MILVVIGIAGKIQISKLTGPLLCPLIWPSTQCLLEIAENCGKWSREPGGWKKVIPDDLGEYLRLCALSLGVLSHGPSTALSPSQTLPPLQTSLQNPKTEAIHPRSSSRRHRNRRKQIPPSLHQVRQRRVSSLARRQSARRDRLGGQETVLPIRQTPNHRNFDAYHEAPIEASIDHRIRFQGQQ
ncbi:hypothetical protein Scep_025690 [Stephania cephalantha]|uniref:Uncharacterized protein n=1 Tax=Stephania cephalantha TaxID=152367 RepID=A0AAP0EIQ2_9MAGN